MTVYKDGYGGDKTTYIDTWISAADPNTTSGAATSLFWGAYAADGYRALMKFDFSGLPADAIISSVDFYYYLEGTVGTDTTAHINRVLAANSGWTESGACWNYKTGATAWAGSAGCSTAGTDYATANLYLGCPPNTTGAYNYVTLDLTEFALMRAANYGMVFIIPTASNYRQFDSSDNADTAKYPYITVTYTLPTLATRKTLLGVGV